ncbi:hypothetical protein L914_03605 [Phytophthora nicotianae]|uniref:CREG-like beta-barrel domain-containing protein n=1 Tax=Phytophthora nicotianae TaxID=4792 RepID=W2NVU4_PHYNI|nr:hypothetical protein L914_03605 [Phytophthora nicotianae]
MNQFNQIIAVFLVVLGLIGVEARRNVGIFRADTFRLAETESLYWGASPAQHARQLVHDNIWATLSTISVQFGGVPYGNTVSYSDGVGYSKEDSTGKLFFYLTPMDATGSDLSVNSTASVAISMAQEGEHACKMDVEDPTCWKITLTGKVVPVPADQRHYAEKVLFSKYVMWILMWILCIVLMLYRGLIVGTRRWSTGRKITDSCRTFWKSRTSFCSTFMAAPSTFQ